MFLRYHFVLFQRLITKYPSINNCSVLLLVDFLFPYDNNGGGDLPKTIWNGVVFDDAWNVVLYQSFAHGMHYSIWSVVLCNNIGDTFLDNGWPLLVWSLVYGWNPVLLLRTVPVADNSSFQKLLKNILSRSMISDLGTPCLLTTLSRKISAP